MESPAHPVTGLLGYMSQQVEMLRSLIPKAIAEGDITAIHHARVATRRLKAGIDLLQPAMDSQDLKRFSKSLRKLRQQLGDLRDMDVMIGHLGEFKRSRKLADGSKWLRSQLEARREQAFKKTGGKSRAGKFLSRLGTWWGLRDAVQEAQCHINPALTKSLHTQVTDFARVATALTEHLNSPQASTSPDIHELRIAGKNLRYSVEMAIAQEHPLDSSLLKQFKKMQDSLGLWHDYVVLAERMMQLSVKGLLAHHNVLLQQQILAMAQMCLKKAHLNLAKFCDRWRNSGQEISQAIDSLFTESKTDPDPANSAAPSVPGTSGQSSPPAA